MSGNGEREHLGDALFSYERFERDKQAVINGMRENGIPLDVPYTIKELIGFVWMTPIIGHTLWEEVVARGVKRELEEMNMTMLIDDGE